MSVIKTYGLQVQVERPHGYISRFSVSENSSDRYGKSWPYYSSPSVKL